MKFLVLFGFLCSVVQSAEILLMTHMPTRSHTIMLSALAKGLVKKGHRITMMTPFAWPKSDNITIIHLDGVADLMERQYYRKTFSTIQNDAFWQIMMKLNGYFDIVTELVLTSKNFQRFLKSNSKFDVVVIEAMGNDAHFGLSHHFKAPLVVTTSTGSQPAFHIVGNPAPSSFVPNVNLAYSDRMNFFERISNTLHSLLCLSYLNYRYLPIHEKFYRKYFGNNGPSLQEIRRNVSLVLTYSHVCLESPRPFLPNMIPVGGFHVLPPKKLPQDLQKCLDEATSGVIYFSIGSYLKSTDLPLDKLKLFMNVFKKLPYKVLWKFDNDNFTEIPKNVQIRKWFPQNDLLAHPNVKVFISHGGMLSSTEAVYRGVPIVGMPFYGDQRANTMQFVRAGYGLYVDFESITEESFTKVLTEILTNPKYRENVKKRSAIIKDQPLQPLDTAVFWIEHVLRHGNGDHLKSAAIDLPMYQYLLLDVFAFLIIVTVLIIFIVRKTYNFSRRYYKKRNEVVKIKYS